MGDRDDTVFRPYDDHTTEQAATARSREEWIQPAIDTALMPSPLVPQVAASSEILACEGGSGESAGEDAVFALVERAGGDFRFEEEAELPQRSVSVPTEHLVLEAACRRDHRRRAEDGDVPPAAVPAFASVAGGGATPRFDTLQWKVLAAIDGRKSVQQLSDELRLPLPAVTGVIAGLLRAGALEIS